MKRRLAVLATGVLLTACPVTPPDPFPIGGGPKISGQVENWALGTVASIYSGNNSWTKSPVGPSIGKINADGSFTLGLPTDSQLATLKASFVGCPDPKPVITPSTVKLYPIWIVVNGQTTGSLLNSDKAPNFGIFAPDSLGVRLIYSDGNASISGQCDYNNTLNLTLSPGWNTMVISTDSANKHTYQVGLAPPNLKWFNTP